MWAGVPRGSILWEHYTGLWVFFQHTPLRPGGRFHTKIKKLVSTEERERKEREKGGREGREKERKPALSNAELRPSTGSLLCPWRISPSDPAAVTYY